MKRKRKSTNGRAVGVTIKEIETRKGLRNYRRFDCVGNVIIKYFLSISFNRLFRCGIFLKNGRIFEQFQRPEEHSVLCCFPYATLHLRVIF